MVPQITGIHDTPKQKVLHMIGLKLMNPLKHYSNNTSSPLTKSLLRVAATHVSQKIFMMLSMKINGILISQVYASNKWKREIERREERWCMKSWTVVI